MFFDRAKRLFNNNEKETVKIEYASPKNEYYGRVSDKYGTAQMILVVCLTLVVLVGLMFNNEWISYENFFFFFSDFGEYITSADSDIESIIYHSGSFCDYDIFGDKLAVSSQDGVNVYTNSGRTVLSDSESLPTPVIESAEKYMLVYDFGGNEYRIYNLFTKLHAEKTEYKIYGGDAADNASYAIITGNGTHLSCVNVYNRRFNEILSIGRNSYVTDVSLSPSGDRCAVISYSQNEGEYKTHLYITKTSREKAYAEIEIDGTFPLYCAFSENGFLNVVCNDRLLSYNTRGDVVSEYRLSEGDQIVNADVNRYGMAARIYNNGINTLVCFDKNGKLVFNSDIEDNVTEISVYNSYVFMHGDEKVIRINMLNQEQVKVDKEINSDATMLVKSENEVLLCMKSRVKYIIF